jgi:hypothetical protein
VLDKEKEFRQQHGNEDCNDETLHDMALKEVADDDMYLATCISALSDDNLMSDYETDKDQPAEPGNKIIIRKQPSYRSREVF